MERIELFNMSIEKPCYQTCSINTLQQYLFLIIANFIGLFRSKKRLILMILIDDFFYGNFMSEKGHFEC